jgi:hypothetical protein
MSATVIRSDTSSGGLLISLSAAIDRPQFVTGPQKCVVRGPVGEFRKRITALLEGAAAGAASDTAFAATLSAAPARARDDARATACCSGANIAKEKTAETDGDGVRGVSFTTNTLKRCEFDASRLVTKACRSYEQGKPSYQKEQNHKRLAATLGFEYETEKKILLRCSTDFGLR